MSFDWFLILLPVVLAIGALVKVLTLKPPAYQRKREGDSSSSSTEGADVTLNISRTSSGSPDKRESDAAESHSDGGGD